MSLRRYLTSFYNFSRVQNQANHQIINGDVHFISSPFNGASGGSIAGSTTNDSKSNNNSFTPEDGLHKCLGFPGMFSRKRTIELPHGSTCEWIFDAEGYVQWQSQRQGILWATGKPGVGKSTLTKHVYQNSLDCEKEGAHIVLGFFFDGREQGLQKSSIGMFRSLLYQLCEQDPIARQKVKKVCKEKNSESPNSQDLQWELLELKVLFREVIFDASSLQSVQLYIDALDEAGLDAFHDLTQYFHDLNHFVKGNEEAEMKIWISCRHFPASSMRKELQICVEQHNGDDIASYIHHTLQFDMEPATQQSVWKAMERHLIEKASGTFQWARIITPLVRMKVNEGRSLEEIHGWLDTVPQALQDVYQNILEKVIRPSDRSRSYALLRWVCFSIRPLTIRELPFALAADLARPRSPETANRPEHLFQTSDEGIKKIANTLSGGLVEVVNDTVQLVHYSVHQYLVSDGLSHLTALDLSTSESSPNDNSGSIVGHSNAALFRACLNHLGTEDLEQSARSCSIESLSSRQPLLLYAVEYLFEYARRSNEDYFRELGSDLQVLKEVWPAWLDIYCSHMRGTNQYPSPDATLLMMASGNGLQDMVRSLLEDGEILSAVDVNQNSALHYAVRHGHMEVVRVLVRANADSNSKNRMGFSSLYLAAHFSRIQIVEFLLDHEESQHRANRRKLLNEVLEAAINSENVSVVELALRKGADPDTLADPHGSIVRIESRYTSLAKNTNQTYGIGANALQVAAIDGPLEIVQLLLEFGADVNATGGMYGSALQAAICCGQVEIARMLAERGADIKICGKGGSPLHAAARQGSEELVSILLEHGAASFLNDVCEEDDSLPLLLAARCSLSTARRLQEAGADVHKRSRYGDTALHNAALYGQHDIAQWLLSIGADVSVQDDDGLTPLHAAVTSDLMTAKALYDAGAPLDIGNGDEDGLLFWAALSGKLQIVEWLLTLGVDASAPSALHAASSRSLDIVKLLYVSGAPILGRNDMGRTVLFTAATSGQHTIVQWLLSLHVFDLYDRDNDGSTVLHAAVCSDLRTAKLLYEAGPENLSALSCSGRSVLYDASFSGQVEIVQWLLTLCHSDIMSLTKPGFTPLHAAVATDLETAKLLYEEGADMNARSAEGRSMLHEAALNGQEEITKWLLDLDIFDLAEGPVDYAGNTPLHLALYHDRISVAEILMMQSANPHIPDCHGKTAYDLIFRRARYHEKLGHLLVEPPSDMSVHVEAILHRTLDFTASRLIANGGDPEDFSYFYDLGQALKHLGLQQEACIAFEQEISNAAPRSSDDASHNVGCNQCDACPIIGQRFVCVTCPNVDLCIKCKNHDKSLSLTGDCRGHDFMSVPGPTWADRPDGVVSDAGEEIMTWLRRIRRLHGLENCTATESIMT